MSIPLRRYHHNANCETKTQNRNCIIGYFSDESLNCESCISQNLENVCIHQAMQLFLFPEKEAARKAEEEREKQKKRAEKKAEKERRRREIEAQRAAERQRLQEEKAQSQKPETGESCVSELTTCITFVTYRPTIALN